MSKALRCDKCGETFSPILIDVTDLFTTIPEVRFQTRDDFTHNLCWQRKTDLNFCPRCTNDFLEFMEDFENETGHLSAKLSYSESEHNDSSNVVRKSTARSYSNCETAEWENESK